MRWAAAGQRPLFFCGLVSVSLWGNKAEPTQDESTQTSGKEYASPPGRTCRDLLEHPCPHL